MRAVFKWVMKWTRTLHIYASMFALLALFFFAATGFMLNHPDWFGFKEPRRTAIEGELPAHLIKEPLDTLQTQVVEHLRAQCGATGEVESFEIENEALRVAFQSLDDPTILHVSRTNGHVTKGDGDMKSEVGAIPLALIADPLEKLQLRVAEYLRVHYGAVGVLEPAEIEKDTVRVIFRSPGRMTDVTIKRETGHFEGDVDSFGLTGRLTDLHKGANAGGPWGLLIDGVSILLLFISLTGMILWISLKKRLVFGVIAAFVGAGACAAVYFVYVP